MMEWCSTQVLHRGLNTLAMCLCTLTLSVSQYPVNYLV